MAINLWKVAGKPVAYNPLVGNPNVLIGIGDYVVNFYASSASSANLRVYTQTDLQIKDNALSPTRKFYSLTFNSFKSQNILFGDTALRGDIIIDSIELVQKPLSKLTINGLDDSIGVWEQGSFDTTVGSIGANTTSTTRIRLKNKISVEGGKTYTFKVKDNYSFVINEYSSSNLVLATSINGVWYSQLTFTANAATTSINIRIRINDATTISPEEILNIKPMLNLGTTPAPYSKKTGDKMVMPVPVGNLFDGQLRQGYYNNTNGGFTTTTGTVGSVNLLPVKPNTTYTLKNFSRVTTNKIIADCFDANKNFVLFTSTSVGDTHTFTTTSTTYYVGFSMDGATLTDLFQLEQSSTPTPYKPYAVQVNAKPKRYVPKKNLFDKSKSTLDVFVYSTNGGTNTSAQGHAASDYIYVKPSTNYAPSNIKTATGSGNGVGIAYYDMSKTYISGLSYHAGATLGNFTTPINAYYVRFTYLKVDADIIQLEEGTTQTPYEPYTPIIPRAKTGLAFNGVTDYLQLPSMTMDSIEIDCLIDSVQPDVTPVIFHNGGVFDRLNNTVSSGFSLFTLNGVPTDISAVIPSLQRVKLKYNLTTSITGATTVFSALTNTQHVKGTLYKVTCYLAGSIVAQYDFENPGNIVGDKVLQSAKNLIPSFEDARWSLHANTQVLGKDWLRLNATISHSESVFRVALQPNTKYKILKQGSGTIFVDLYTTSDVKTVAYFSDTEFTTASNIAYGLVKCSNFTSGAGTFDFIKPQLYQLDSKEGTIVGNPTKLRKPSKRKLYRKR